MTQHFVQAIKEGPDALNGAMLRLMSASAAFRRSAVFALPGLLDKVRAYIEQKTSDYPSENPDFLSVTSAVFNRKLPYYLKKTTDGLGGRMIEDGQNAAISYAKLPFSERKRFLQIFKDKINTHAEKIRLSIIGDTGTYEGEALKVDEHFDSVLKQAEMLDVKMTDKSLVYIVENGDEPYGRALGAIVAMLAIGKAVVISPNDKAPDWVFHVIDAADQAIEEFKPDAGLVAEELIRGFNKFKSSLVTHNIGVPGTRALEKPLLYLIFNYKKPASIDKPSELQPV